MIWLVLFVALTVLALLVFLGLVAAGAETGGWLAVFIGGFMSLVLPGLITRCLYVIPEFERVVVLKLGKFVAVRGPGMFWVVPYPPFYQSVAAELDIPRADPRHHRGADVDQRQCAGELRSRHLLAGRRPAQQRP